MMGTDRLPFGARVRVDVRDLPCEESYVDGDVTGYARWRCGGTWYCGYLVVIEGAIVPMRFRGALVRPYIPIPSLQ